MPVQVYYNNNLIGEPFISKSYSPMDFGNRWGMTETITLNGYIDPINGVQTQTKQDEFGNPFTEIATGEIHSVTNIFKENFKSFQVKDNGVVLPEYNIASCLVDEISFDKGKWSVGTPVKYTVKLKAYDVFDVDAVLEPSDNWSWTENEDGSVNGVHKISAKGIKTGTLSAFDRARSFVDKRVNHTNGVGWGAQAFAVGPYFSNNHSFLNGATFTLMSVSENVNRLEGSYSVTENWKYYKDTIDECPNCFGNAWQANYASEADCRTAEGCVQYPSVLKSDKMTQAISTTEDFHTVDYEVEYKDDLGDGLLNIRNRIDADVANFAFEKAIAGQLLGTESNFTKVYQAGISINEDIGGNKISIKGSYLTGDSNLLEGYFDYKIDLSRDEIKQITTYSIGGEYITYGNLETKQKYVKAFKDSYYDNATNNIQNYLWGKLTSSPMYQSWLNAPCVKCDNDDWQDDPKGPAPNGDDTFTTEVGCRQYYKCESRTINPYPKSLKWDENEKKGTLSINAEFSDEDYIAGTLATPKWNVQVTNGKQVRKEVGACNIDGVFVLQDLNCLTSSSTKISVNSDVRQGVPGWKTTFHADEGFGPTPDHQARQELSNLMASVAAKAVPDTPKSLDADGNLVVNYEGANDPSDFNRALVDDNTDANFPYTFSHSQAYLHTPTKQNKDLLRPHEIVNGVAVSAGPLNIVGYNHWNPQWQQGGGPNQRDAGYKFGY